MSQPIQPYIYTTYIRTTPEKLWQALTSADFSEKYWFGYRIEGDWKLGGKLNFQAPKNMNPHLAKKADSCLDDDSCKVLIYEPPRRLSYTFPNKEADTHRKPSRVTFDLTPMGEMVKLRLVHEDLLPQDVNADPTSWSGINNGWPGVISSLKSLLETGQEIVYSGKAG